MSPEWMQDRMGTLHHAGAKLHRTASMQSGAKFPSYHPSRASAGVYGKVLSPAADKTTLPRKSVRSLGKFRNGSKQDHARPPCSAPTFGHGGTRAAVSVNARQQGDTGWQGRAGRDGDGAHVNTVLPTLPTMYSVSRVALQRLARRKRGS